MKTVAITGGSGFVGKRFLDYNSNRFRLKLLLLRDVKIDEMSLKGIDTIVHFAGKAHQMNPIEDSIYFDINYELSRQLADKARTEGVQHFIYISSTKVFGDETTGVLNERSSCFPVDAYGASKYKAEQYLLSISSEYFTIAIVRPPLVYGPGVKGNMIKLLELAEKKYPLPFGKSNNYRSMVFIDNLIELINRIIERQAAGVFIAGDVAPVSTETLVSLMRRYMSKKAGLINLPGICRTIIRKFKPALYQRLFGSFIIDNGSTNMRLDFIPPYSTEYGVEQMVKWFKKSDK